MLQVFDWPGRIEGVGRWAWEGQIGVIDAGIGLGRIGGITLQQHACLKNQGMVSENSSQRMILN